MLRRRAGNADLVIRFVMRDLMMGLRLSVNRREHCLLVAE
jgi:hypothetical protein